MGELFGSELFRGELRGRVLGEESQSRLLEELTYQADTPIKRTAL